LQSAIRPSVGPFCFFFLT